MIIDGKAFAGTLDYELTDRPLKLRAGNTSCITEFRPVRLPSAMMIFNFLHLLRKYLLCCFLTGTFVLFSAWGLGSFDGMSAFIAVTDSPVLNFIFQKFRFPKFMIDDFTLKLIRTDRKEDTFHYIVSSEDFNLPVILGSI